MEQKIQTKSNSKIIDNGKLIKTLLVFICYFLYSNITSIILSTFKVTNTTLVSFVADILFLIGIVFAYRNNLKSDLETLKKDYSIVKIVKTVVAWVVIIFIFNILMGALTEVLFPNLAVDDNTNAITSLSNISTLYTIFKTMIFAVIAEELLFRESIGDVIKNKPIFLIVTALVYSLTNFVFVGFKADFNLMYILMYFLPALLFSAAYVKNKNNVIILMLIKFFYNLIPLIILLFELYNKI